MSKASRKYKQESRKFNAQYANSGLVKIQKGSLRDYREFRRKWQGVVKLTVKGRRIEKSCIYKYLYYCTEREKRIRRQNNA